MSTADAPILALSIDRNANEAPAYLQLYQQLRQMILSARIRPRARLPSSRALAGELGLSRGTVVAAYELLASEGYVEGRIGSGAYVAPRIPEQLLQTRPAVSPETPAVPAVTKPRARQPPFAATSTALDSFPHADWARALQAAWRAPSVALLDNPDPQGFLPLRAAIAQHLRAWRGIDADPAQIFIVSGTTEALELVAAALVKPGQRAWTEDPGYPAAFAALARLGLRPVPVRVDMEGIDVGAGVKAAPDARLAFVTPSHQYPLGFSMSLARRLALVDWAERRGAYIVEDDYASEYRYAGRPLTALMGLDRPGGQGGGRVLYAGTFSKVMFPALRLAYLVAPPAAVPAVAAALARTGPRASTIAQVPLAEFIASGRFAQHIRRMRRLYAERQRALRAAIDTHLKGMLRAEPVEAGLHLVARLTPKLARRMTDADIADSAAALGIDVRPLSRYSRLPPDGVNEPPQQGLVMGFAGFDAAEMENAARTLADALSPFSGAGTRGRPSRAGRRRTR